jgi:receptor protein-tyrosine kinase
MTLSEIGRIVRRRWLVVVVATSVCAGIAAAYALSLPTTYTATTRLYVSMATGTSVSDSYQGGMAAQQRVTSYSHVAGGFTVAERVVSDLDLPTTPEELQSRIAVEYPPASALLDISVTDSTPEGARTIADKVAAHFRSVVGELETTTAGAAPAAEATVVDPAQLPTAPDGPDVTRLLTIGLLGGIGLGGLGAFVRDRLDPRVRRPEQLTDALPEPVLGFVPRNAGEARIVFTRLRAWLLSRPDAPKPSSLLFTSASRRSVPGVSMGLSATTAATGRRTVLVDADVSQGGVSAQLNIVGTPGLAEWLRTPDSTLDELLRQPADGYAVLPLGAADQHTSDLLDSPRLPELLSQLEARFDLVIVDTAPVATDAAAVTLARHCDAVLTVVELGTSRSDVEAATVGLREAGAPLLGTVVAARPAHRQQQRRRDTTATAARPSLLPSA